MLSWQTRSHQYCSGQHLPALSGSRGVVFKDSLQQHCMPVMDLMASANNANASSRHQERTSEGLDALVQPRLQEDLLYVFPLWTLIGHLLHQIAQQAGHMILVAPDWPMEALIC